MALPLMVVSDGLSCFTMAASMGAVHDGEVGLALQLAQRLPYKGRAAHEAGDALGQCLVARVRRSRGRACRCVAPLVEAVLSPPNAKWPA